MDMSRTMHKKRRAVRKLIESFPKEEVGREGSLNGFKFPPPPEPPDTPTRLPPSGSTDTSDTCSTSSSALEEPAGTRSRRPPATANTATDEYDYPRGGYTSDGNPPHRLPPIGVFWDIENCQIPHGKSATLVAQAVRERFFRGFREAEFIVVCDVKKESPQIIQELNDAQVNLIHVPSTSKNAADEKLRQSMRRFADTHGFPAAIVLISGDINFASDLSDLRHRKKLHIILLHNSACSIALILCANEHYNFDQFVMPIPPRGMSKTSWRSGPMEVMIWNLPRGCGVGRLKERLRYLSYNCGGRITFLSESVAVVRFPSFEAATRAHKRMNGEVMYGNQIGVSYPQRAGTLKKETNSNNTQFPSHFCANGMNSSQNEQNGFNTSYDASSNNFGYFRSTSLQESTTNGGTPQKNLPYDNQWFWDVFKTTPGPSSQNVTANNEMLNAGSTAFSADNEPSSTNNSSRYDFFKQQDMNYHRESLASRPTAKNVPGSLRKCRTPSPYLVKPKTLSVVPAKNRKPSPENLDSEKYFNPIQTHYVTQSQPFNSSSPIELHITNLDQSIDPIEMKKILMQIFSEHVMVLHVSVFVQSDGNFVASVKVPSLQHAQFAISQLHRRKIGFKRIMISYAHSNQPHNPQFVRWQIVNLLEEVPGSKLPLFKFLKLFESRYVSTISLSDLYRLKDVCTISEESGGRMVSLNPDLRNSPSPNFNSPQDVAPYCSRHYKVPRSFGKGWAEQEVPPLPSVCLPLREFSSATLRLIATHANALPLSSFADCYEAEIGKLPVSESGVPLEHLVTCVDKVELAITNGVKFLKPAPPQNFLDDRTEEVSKGVSPSLASQLHLFSRELTDLLRTQPHCQLLFNRLIPAYHHHFGRQCRVADYGFTKLVDLLEAIPNVAQVIGDGNKRMVTLSHKAQMKRFTTDLLRALKSQPSKKITSEEIPQVFERVLGKAFDPADYGLCTLSDLIDHLPESTVLVSRGGGGGSATTLAIPKREQTVDEVVRTKQFAKEVVELLVHAPQCCIPFDQFIPAYHHHFGHQCRVADFGFTKLIELFEAIPDVVEVSEDSEGERKVTLTQAQKLCVVGGQIRDLVIPTYPPGLPLNSLSAAFLWQYGYALKPQVYRLNSIEELINSIDTVKLERGEMTKVVVPVESALLSQLMSQVKNHLLLRAERGRMPLSMLLSHFSPFHAAYLTVKNLSQNLSDAILIQKEGREMVIELTELYQVGRRLAEILNRSGGHMSLGALEAAYRSSGEGGGGLAGRPSLAAVLADLSSIVTVKGKAFKRHVFLNKDLVTRNESSNKKAVCRPLSASFLPSQFETYEDSSIPRFSPDKSRPLVKLPEMEALPASLLQTASSMISPCKGLLPPSAVPPHPSQLPIPLYLSPDLNKLKYSMFARDSKTGDNKEQDVNVNPSPANKRKVRLAAQFQTPLELEGAEALGSATNTEKR